MINAEEFVSLFIDDSTEECRKTYTGLATVTEFTDNKVIIRIDGEREVSGKLRSYLASYSPKQNDRVLVFRDIVIGKIK